MKVLVTGAAGYIGRYVVTQLLEMGHAVIASDLRYELVDARAQRCAVPIFSDAEDLYDQLGRPDAVIHMAWRDGFVHNSPLHMACLSDHMIFCQKLIRGGLPSLSVMGSMHEIGYYEGAVDENTPCNPLSQYGVAKNAMRQSLTLTLRDSSCRLRWLRAYYIVGDDAHNNSIFTKIVKAAEEGKRQFPFTTGRNQYDFIDVKDLARMIAVASVQNEVTGIINVCTGKPVSLADRVEQFIRDNRLDITLQYGAFLDRPYDSRAIWGNAEKIQKIMSAFEAGEAADH